jgi:hypothetical protein
MRGLALSLLLLPLAAAAEDPPKPVAAFKPASGFIDDAFAVRDDGGAVVYLTTDGAKAVQLHIAPLPSGAEKTVDGLSDTVKSLHWLGPDRVLVVSRGDDPETVTAQVWTSAGPGKEKLGPAVEIALAEVNGKPALVSYARSEKKGVEHSFTAVARDGWKPLARRSYKEVEGMVAHPSGGFRILWWNEGLTSAQVQRAGEFDKARDMRRPDRFARLEVFTGKVSPGDEITDVLGFTQLAIEHKKRGGLPAFVHLSDDHKKLLLTDGNAQNEVTLARPLYMYEAGSFAWQLVGADRVAVSGTVDPMNPPALQRKKAEPDDFDLHLVERKTQKAARVMMLPGDGRPTAWRIAGGHVALLRKSKGFDRGGVALEIYKLP